MPLQRQFGLQKIIGEKDMSNNKVVVALDCDGVLADFEKHFYTVVEELYGSDVRNIVTLGPMPVRDYLGLSREHFEGFMDAMFRDVDAFPVVDGALDGYARLKNGGYNLIIVTARKCVPETEQWLLNKGFGGIQPYFLFRDKQELPKFDYILDDSPSKIAQLKPWTREKAYLMKSPQNVDCPNPFNNFEKVNDWEEFLVKMGV